MRPWTASRRPPARRTQSPSGMRTSRCDGHGVTTRRSRTLSVPSTPEHLGCRKVAERGRGGGEESRFRCKSLVGARGFEPRTSSLSEKHPPISDPSSNAHATAASARASAAPRRAQFVCQRVVGGLSGRLPRTIYLQISGGPHRARTGDLRRASASTSLLISANECR